MFDVNATAVLIGLLLVMVFAGFHVVAALGIAAVICLAMITGGDWDMVFYMLGTTAHEALRSYVFAVIPLFMFMGEFIARSGAAADIFNALNRRLRAIPGGLGHATVIGNAIFGFVTGTSLAAATAFTRIAYPQMKRYGYDQLFAHGIIAGSACLGMLIPPSVLMIVWGILTEQSIGALFIAGIIPGLLLAALQMAYILSVGLLNPAKVGRFTRRAPVGAAVTQSAPRPLPEPADLEASNATSLQSLLAILGVIAITLGGIWAGWFTPTEGAGIGAVLGLALGIAKGMRLPQIYDAILSVGRTAVPIMILLFAAQLYSRVLAMSGVGVAVQDFFTGMGLGPYGTLLVMILIWIVLGMFIDSISIMLLTVPIFVPVATSLGFDPIHFAIIGILAIEAGILTPPFGLLVYGVKAASPEPGISLASLFLVTTPYWILLLIEIVLILMIPALATGLPNLLR